MEKYKLVNYMEKYKLWTELVHFKMCEVNFPNTIMLVVIAVHDN